MRLIDKIKSWFAASEVQPVVLDLSYLHDPVPEEIVTEVEAIAEEPVELPLEEPIESISPPPLFKQPVLPFAYTSSEFMRFGLETISHGSLWSSVARWMTNYYPQEINRPIEQWHVENTKAAKLLLDLHGDALTLFFDGTPAAHAMILAFRDAGKIPRVYALRFKNDDNALLSPVLDDGGLSDLYFQCGFSLRTINLASKDFWQNQVQQITRQYQVISSVEAIRMWAVSAAAGVPVFPGGIPYIQKSNDGWEIGDHEQFFLLDKMVRDNKTTAIPAFFRYTPEQLLSFFAQMPVQLEKDGFTNSYDAGPNLLLSPYFIKVILKNPELSPDAALFERDRMQKHASGRSLSWHKLKAID